MGKWANVFVTLGLISVTFVVAITLTSIGDALTIVGSTITPTAGYLMPAAFYLKSTPEKRWLSAEKILPVLVSMLIVVTSVISLVNFFMYKEG
jgi:amino acid permease